MKQTKCPQCNGQRFEKVNGAGIYRCKNQNCRAMVSGRTGIQVWWSPVMNQYVTLPS